MSDTSLSRSPIVGHDLLDDEEAYLYDLSEEELGSVAGGTFGLLKSLLSYKIGLIKTIIAPPVSCTCYPQPEPPVDPHKPH